MKAIFRRPQMEISVVAFLEDMKNGVFAVWHRL